MLRVELTLDNTMGAILIGVIVSAILYGATLVQTFYYYTSMEYYSSGKRRIYVPIRVSRGSLVSEGAVYHYLVTNYTNPHVLKTVVWYIVPGVIVLCGMPFSEFITNWPLLCIQLEALYTNLTAALVQGSRQAFILCVYGYVSISNFWGNGPMSAAFSEWVRVSQIDMSVLIQKYRILAWMILAFKAGTFDRVPATSAVTSTVVALATAIDIIITLSLCVLLHKARTGWLGALSRENVGLVAPETQLYAAFYCSMGRHIVYTISFLATLNARRSHFFLTIPPTGTGVANRSFNAKTFPDIAIRVDTTQTQDVAEGDK
ncbi:hypothetical protein L208DRAFT_1555643 [Tricholoma matsutake]|nr:hypothetical protein L208DRAFT_1555643 [Tricholoma matsutake 945]